MVHGLPQQEGDLTVRDLYSRMNIRKWKDLHQLKAFQQKKCDPKKHLD